MEKDSGVPAASGQSVGASLALLIERLEHATGGSIELNGEIWWHVNRPAAERVYWNAATGLPQPIERMALGLGRVSVCNRAPGFTHVVDDALRLVPPGWSADMCAYAGGAANARLFKDGMTDGAHHRHGLPLALCIAALRVRATLTQHEAPTPAQRTAGTQNTGAA